MSEPTTIGVNPVPQSSVEFTTSAKGVVQATVKVYGEDPKAVLALAMEVYLDAQKFAQTVGVAA